MSASRTGIEDDTFLHLFDAWVEGALERSSRHDVDAAERALNLFTEEMGDRFADADELAEALADWSARYGSSVDPKAESVVGELLRVWRGLDALES